MRKKNFGAAFHADFRQIPSLRSEPASMQKESKANIVSLKEIAVFPNSSYRGRFDAKS
jgi:hypothetical protein